MIAVTTTAAGIDEELLNRCLVLSMDGGRAQTPRHPCRPAGPAHPGRPDTQLKIHLSRLVEMEYLGLHPGGRGSCFEYELLFDGLADGATAEGGVGSGGKVPHMTGLIDAQALQAYDAGRSGLEAMRSGSGRPPAGGQSGGSRGVVGSG